MSVDIRVEAMKFIRSAYERGGVVQGQFYISEMQDAFIAGAEWQREQDAANRPRPVPSFEIHGSPAARLQELVQQSDVAWIRVSTKEVRVMSDMEAHDDGVMRLLSSIENRLIELAGGPGIERLSGWLERLDKDLYHVTTRQEQIDIQHRRYLDDIYRHIFHKDNENGCPEPEQPGFSVTKCVFPEGFLDLTGGEAPEGVTLNLAPGSILKGLYIRPARPSDYIDEKRIVLDDAVRETPGTFGGEFSRLVKEAYMKTPPIVAGFDPSRGDDFTSVFAFDVTRKATPLEEVSDEMLDQMKEQIPVGVYVAEVSRRQSLKAKSEAVDGLRKERDDWRHAYEKLLSDILHGRAFSVTIKPD